MSSALELMRRSTLPFWLTRLFQAVHTCTPAALDERSLAALLSWLGLARSEDGRQLQQLAGVAGADAHLLQQVFALLDEHLFEDGQLHRQRAGVGHLVPAAARRRRFRLLLSAYHPDRYAAHAGYLTGCSQAILAAYREFKEGGEGHAPASAPGRGAQVPDPPAAAAAARRAAAPVRAADRRRPRRRRAWLRAMKRRWGGDRWFGHKLVALFGLLAALPVLDLFLAPAPPPPVLDQAGHQAAMTSAPADARAAARLPADGDGPAAEAVPTTAMPVPAGPMPRTVAPTSPAAAPAPATAAAPAPPAGDQQAAVTASPAVPAAAAALAPGGGRMAAEPDASPAAPAKSPAPGAQLPGSADGPAGVPAAIAAPAMPAVAVASPAESGSAPARDDASPPASAARSADGSAIARAADRDGRTTLAAAGVPRSRTPSPPVGSVAAAGPASGHRTAPAAMAAATAPAGAAMDPAVPASGTGASPPPAQAALVAPEPRTTTMAAAGATAVAGPAGGELVQRQDSLVRSYQRSIEAGDLAMLADLLAEDAHENGQTGRAALMRVYGHLFQRSQDRSLALVLRERWPEDDAWVIQADYRLTVRFPDQQAVDRQGQVRYRIRDDAGRLRISGIEY